MNGGVEGGAAAVAAEEVARAIKASGAIVSVEPDNFMTILARVDKPLVVCSQSKFLGTRYHYLTSYKGLIFYTKSSSPLMLRPSIEQIHAKKIWIPG